MKFLQTHKDGVQLETPKVWTLDSPTKAGNFDAIIGNSLCEEDPSGGYLEVAKLSDCYKLYN